MCKFADDCICMYLYVFVCASTQTPKLKPQIYRLSAGKSLFLGGLARLDYEEGPPMLFSVFVPNPLPIHPTNIEACDKLLR